MSTDQDNFGHWFVDAISQLKEMARGRGGFAAMMVSLGMLERFLRHKAGIGDKNLGGAEGNKFYKEFVGLFPSLTESEAETFWKVFRHGLMHQATLKLYDNTRGELTGAVSGIDYDSTKREFRVNPWDFSDTVLAAIKGDFQHWVAPSDKEFETSQVNLQGGSGNIP